VIFTKFHTWWDAPFAQYPKDVLLSVDWDFFSGCIEHVFDAPIWGSKDTDYDRSEAWKERTRKRNGNLSTDFPLLEDWRWLLQFVGIKTFATLSHADAYVLLEKTPFSNVINLDSHHDLFSSSGDPKRVRAGNWAGLALEHGLIQNYTCVYPNWHEHVRVTEGFDLERTKTELGSRFTENITLERKALNQLEFKNIEMILLVQSPAWTNPEHDPMFFELCQVLNAEYLTVPLQRLI
jgi:hypothetical protein